ncbi:MAG: IS110 family transposase [Mycobacteriales bacterium]
MAQEGSAALKVGLPGFAIPHIEEADVAAVMIGVDPAKRSHAMAVLDGHEEQLAALEVGNDTAGYRAMLTLAKRWPDRTWAVEGAGGVGVQLAQRLVADGETVVDVPPKLSTRARIFDRGHGRKNDPTDARTVAVVALRTRGLREVALDDELIALRLMSERRTDLVRSRTATVNHLHQLLMELIPSGAERNLTATKAKALLATVRPRHVAGRTRRQLAADLIEDLAGLDRKLKDLDKRLREAVDATGTELMTIKGVGVATAAMVLGEVGDVRRFPTRHHFATYNGTAPREYSSGGVETRRLSRAGNRKLNHALHVIAMANKRYDQRGSDYYARKLADGKGKKGALRCLKRRLSDAIFRVLADERARREVAGPEGQMGATTKSCAANRTPMVSTSEKPLAGPATPDATPHQPRRKVPA